MQNTHTATQATFANYFQDLIAIPTATNRVGDISAYLKGFFAQKGASFRELADGTLIVDYKHETASRHIAYGAHMDRIGLMVRHLHEDGSIEMEQIGGLYAGHLMEGTVARVVTPENTLAGHIRHVKTPIHSMKSLKEFQDRPQAFDKLRFHPDATIANGKKGGKERLTQLGVEVGQLVWLDHACAIDTENATFRSRWIDNTLAVAALMCLMNDWAENPPAFNASISLVFTVAEEVGMGGSSISHEPFTDFIAVDVSKAEEVDDITQPSLSCMAGKHPLSEKLIAELFQASRQHNEEDTFAKFISVGGGTDAEQARKSGFSGRIGSCGIPVYNMHSLESGSLLAAARLVAALNTHARESA